MSGGNTHNTTLHGLKYWFVHVFEKAGWMILTLNRNDETTKTKFESYLQGLEKLHKDLQDRTHNSRGNTTIEKDFVTMAQDVEGLLKQMIEYKKIDLQPSEINASSDLVAKDATLCGLHKWYEYKFEKFGWMILVNNKLIREGTENAYHQHLIKKLDLYKEGLELLAQSLNHRSSTSDDLDKENVEHDLNVMENNVKILLDAFNKKNTSNQISLTIGNLVGGANKYIHEKKSKMIKKGSKKGSKK